MTDEIIELNAETGVIEAAVIIERGVSRHCRVAKSDSQVPMPMPCQNRGVSSP